MCGCVRVTCNLYTDDVDASEQCKRRGRVHGSAVPHDSRPSSRYQQTCKVEPTIFLLRLAGGRPTTTTMPLPARIS